MMRDLCAEKAYIFRIVHRDNLAWILRHGLHCRSARLLDPRYVEIGNPELISKRGNRVLPIAPRGTLSDYVPFYFTPRSPRLLNIRTGHNGIRRRSNEEIVILVSSLHKVAKLGVEFLFSDRHAYVPFARFYSDVARLDVIDWEILRRSDFRRDNEDLGKLERYQAEALVHQHVPIDALRGVACVNDAEAARIRTEIGAAGAELKVAAKPRWYF
jgi:hypothetical protein